MSKKILLLFILGITGTHLLAQNQRKLEKTASKLDAAVNDLQSNKTFYGQDMLAIDTIVMLFNQMNTVYQMSNDRVSKDYIASLKNDLAILKRILATNDNENVSEQISFIKRSFQYKSVLLDTSVTTSVYRHVNTTIRVIVDGIDVNGYSITANPEVWFDKKPLHVFDPLSPTSKKNDSW